MGGRLQDRVAVVTGGASGIGLATAERFVEQGAFVMIGDLNGALAEQEAKRLGARAVAAAVDVRVEAEIEALVEAAVRRFGRLDIAVQSAGLASFSPLVDQSEEQWDTVLDVCLKGVFLCMKHAARRMRAQGQGGVLLNIASLNAFQPGEGLSAYCAAKAGVEMLTRVGAMELGADRIRVCGIAPGLIETPLTAAARAVPAVREGYLENIPLGRAGTAADIAAAALYLVSDDADWVSGTTLSVDGASNTKRYPELIKIFGALAGAQGS